MTDLVTLDEVKLALRIDSFDDDDLLEPLITTASEAVVGYLKDQAEVLIPGLTDSPADIDPPKFIKQATILLVDYYHRGDFQGAEPGYLPPHVTALLYSKRTPTIA